MRVSCIKNFSLQGLNKSVVKKDNASIQSDKTEHGTVSDSKYKSNKVVPYIIGASALIASAVFVGKLCKSGSVRINDIPIVQDIRSVSEEIKPKFLYHMTSMENYESICADGFVKKSVLGDGVFLSDKFTIKNKYDDNTLMRMINWYGGYMQNFGGPASQSHKVVILKFPVNQSEENLFKWRPIKLVGADNNQLSDEWLNFADIGKEELMSSWQRPVEFLYKNQIPADKLEKIAEIDLSQLPKQDFISSFKELSNI